MQFLLPVVGMFAAYGVVLVGLGWVAVRARRRGVGGSVLGAVDEIFHPIACQPRIEIQLQAERKVPIPAPGDRPWLGTSAVSITPRETGC